MLERHVVRPSGLKVERDWWIVAKVVALVVAAMVAGYLVSTTLL